MLPLLFRRKRFLDIKKRFCTSETSDSSILYMKKEAHNTTIEKQQELKGE